MGVLNFKTRGSFKYISEFLKRAERDFDVSTILDKYGRMGVDALAAHTPKDTGVTASSWDYETSVEHGTYSIYWYNTNTNKGSPIAILLQYGHATGTGGYVYGKDYINPAVRPIFDQISKNIWKEVTR